MKFPVMVEATQWNKPGDHPNVKAAGPNVYISGELAYVNGMSPLAQFWMDLEPTTVQPEKSTGGFGPDWYEFSDKDGAGKYWRRVYSFSFWDIKGEKREVPVDEHKQFVEDYQMIERAYAGPGAKERVPHGWIQPPAADGQLVVYPGNWIVVVDGRTLIMTDEKYKALYGGIRT